MHKKLLHRRAILFRYLSSINTSNFRVCKMACQLRKPAFIPYFHICRKENQQISIRHSCAFISCPAIIIILRLHSHKSDGKLPGYLRSSIIRGIHYENLYLTIILLGKNSFKQWPNIFFDIPCGENKTSLGHSYFILHGFYLCCRH